MTQKRFEEAHARRVKMQEDLESQVEEAVNSANAWKVTCSWAVALTGSGDGFQGFLIWKAAATVSQLHALSLWLPVIFNHQSSAGRRCQASSLLPECLQLALLLMASILRIAYFTTAA